MKRLFFDYLSLIEDGINTLNQEGEKLPADSLSNIPVLKHDLIKSIDLMIMSFSKGVYVKRSLHHLQLGIVDLLDLLFKQNDEIRNEEFYKNAKKSLIEVLTTLRQKYPNYFNLMQAIPQFDKEEFSATIESRLVQLRAGFKSRKIDPNLADVILEPFVDSKNKQSMNFGQFEYLNDMFAVLLLTLRDGRECEASLLQILLSRGFNTLKFENFYMTKISAETYTNFRTEHQFECLYEYERRLGMIPKTPVRCYEPLRPNSRRTLLSFVSLEMNYLNNKKNLWQQPHTTGVSTPSFSTYQIQTSLSVDRLAYLLRLLIESGIIEGTPRAALLNFIANHVQTLQKTNEPLSEKSLKNKYKQVTQYTAMAVRGLMVRMVNKVDEDFGAGRGN